MVNKITLYLDADLYEKWQRLPNRTGSAIVRNLLEAYFEHESAEDSSTLGMVLDREFELKETKE